MDIHYDTPQDTEDGFYDAFENADLHAMKAIWSDTADIVCIHPGSPILHGWEAMSRSWQHIFGADSRVSFTIHHRQWIEHSDLAIHTVEEEIAPAGSNKALGPPIPVTNVYRRGAHGWRMVVHHASPPPVDPKEIARTMARNAPPRGEFH